MLIDDFLPRWDVRERHAVKVNAPVEDVYAAARRLDLRRAALTRRLFRLRGMPSSSDITLDDFLKMRFTLLGERPGEEILLGLVGQFWKPSGNLRRLDVGAYAKFDEPGFAKAAWNFSLSEQAGGVVLLQTETRVRCLDDRSRWRFRLYWSIVGVFSGLIRREMLRTVKLNAELSAGRHSAGRR